MYSYPITGLDRLLRFQEVEAPNISIQLAHGGGKVVSPPHQLPLPPGDISGTQFSYRLIQPPRTQCGWKDYVNEKS